jgi:hypothetical protein
MAVQLQLQAVIMANTWQQAYSLLFPFFLRLLQGTYIVILLLFVTSMTLPMQYN